MECILQLKTKMLNPAGEWNNTTIRFTPEKVTYYLNGEVMLEFVPWSEDWNQRKNDGKWGMAEDYGKFKKGVYWASRSRK
jgi:hypothetical protein